MRAVTRIEATLRIVRKRHVAACCRGSTLFKHHAASLENQQEHCLNYIGVHREWALADIYVEDIYVDEGITGKKKELRDELNRMLADLREHPIDLSLTKSISRFARNTVDCPEMVRALTDRKVRIAFGKESLDKGLMGSAFILTILSSLAEEKSRSTSANEKWSIWQRIKSGTFYFRQAPYGYRWSHGTFIPDPADSAVVQWMFDKVLEGRYIVDCEGAECGGDPHKIREGADEQRCAGCDTEPCSDRGCSDEQVLQKQGVQGVLQLRRKAHARSGRAPPRYHRQADISPSHRRPFVREDMSVGEI